jgi:hypothetical protein
MPRLRTLLIPAAILGAALVAAQAANQPGGAVAPGQAHLASLGDARAVAYYTVEQGGGFRVVVTVATAEDAPPVRATMTLQPGQTTSVSVPGEPGTAPYEITFSRSGDRLTVMPPRQQEAALR